MKTYLDEDDLEKLGAAAGNARDRLLIRFLIRTGCRISEALGLRIEDIDFAVHTITIQHLKTRIGLDCSKCGARLGKNHKFCPKCGLEVLDAVSKERDSRRYRRIPVDEATLKILKEYLQISSLVSSANERLVFNLSRYRAWQIIRGCAEKAGLPKLVNAETGKVHNVSPHRLRDAFAVRAVKHDDSGDGLRLLQEYMGHQSFNTTAKYRKISGEEHHQWYQVSLERIILSVS